MTYLLTTCMLNTEWNSSESHWVCDDALQSVHLSRKANENKTDQIFNGVWRVTGSYHFSCPKLRQQAVGLLTWRNKTATRSFSLRFTCYMTHTEAHILRTPATDRVWRSPAVPGSTHTEGDMEIHHRGDISAGGWGARHRCCLQYRWRQVS